MSPQDSTDGSNECDCPACDNPKHHDKNICIPCFHNECKGPYGEFSPNCEGW